MLKMTVVLALTVLAHLLAAEGYSWPERNGYVGTYVSNQSSVLRTADDELRYATKLRWSLRLYVESADANQAVLKVIVSSIKGERQAPEGVVAFDSAQPEAVKDPFLGHHVAFIEVPLRLTVMQATGVVRTVEGGEALVARLDALVPRAPTEPPPLHAQALATFAPERLAAHWTEILTLPGNGVTTTQLPAPLAITVQRTWNGENYALGLLEATPPPQPIALGEHPTPMQLTLRTLTGAGAVQLSDGALLASKGSTQAQLAGSFQGQTASIDLDIAWSFGLTTLVVPKPPAETP